MAKTIADQFAETLVAACVKRIYGVGDSLNGPTDSLRRQKQDQVGSCPARGSCRFWGPRRI
jgi:hypothetical protein